MPTGFMLQEAHTYLEQLVPARHPELQAMEAYAKEHKFPIIGPAAGYFCYLTARLIRAKRVFEMGSGFGYSTLWFARAVGPGGLVVHTEGSAENSALARDFLGRAGLTDRVRFEVGDAREIIDREIANAPRNRNLPLRRAGHRVELVLVDRAGDDGRAIALRQRADLPEFFLALLEVHRVEDAPPGREF